MHADLFLCRMTAATESDRKAFSPGRSVRQVAIKKWKERKAPISILCQKKNKCKHTHTLKMANENNFLNKEWGQIIITDFKGGFICLLY